MLLEIPGYQIKKQLYKSTHSVIYQGCRESEGLPVVLKMLQPDYPNPEELSLFRSEYEMALNLEGEGIIGMYGLETHRNTLVMVMEDFNGKSLTQWMLNQWNEEPEKLGTYPGVSLESGLVDLREFLRMAIPLTGIVRQLHQQNVIHKNINPSNIIWNRQTNQIKLIDFGIAMALPKEISSMFRPHKLEGTIAYISPEQTGRLNVTMDYRADLYSLGVTFYEILTGQLPFRAKDPMELVHCHLAKQPRPPHKINPQIPVLLSEIILKLMAKTAEDRYQSAFGLKADLEQCLEDFEKNDTITVFPIGQHDISAHFRIPQKLYGRKEEVMVLLSAFERVSESLKEVLLITGQAGVGKSALVHEIRKVIVQKKGYFASGNFEKLKRNIPYAALIQMFQGLILDFLSENEDQIADWSQKLRKAVGTNGQVIIEVIPEVERIIGPQPPVPELPSVQSQNRFNYVFQNFIRTLGTLEHPLVMFLDDLQWADSASINLLRLFMSDEDTHNLIFIGTYRENEVDTAHPLMSVLDAIQETGISLQTLHLSPLSLEAANQLLADTLRCSLSHTQDIAQICFEKTQGNPFFLRQFLHSLYTKGLIAFDSGQRVWRWQTEAIRQANITANVVELMTSKIQKLPKTTQEVLKLAACLGNQFELQTLLFLFEENDPWYPRYPVNPKFQNLEKDKPDEESWKVERILLTLRPALEERLILPINFSQNFLSGNVPASGLMPKNSTFKFSHERMQEIAYSLIKETDKAQLHLKIGRFLLAKTPQEELNDNPFAVVEHWNKAYCLLQEKPGNVTDISELEKLDFAKLNFTAGQKAKKTMAYPAAINYLKVGVELFSKMEEDPNHPFLFELYIELTEATFLATDFKEANRLYAFLLEKACSDQEKYTVYTIQLEQLMVEGKFAEAVEVASKALKIMGIDVPVSQAEASQFFNEELAKFSTYLAGRKISDLAQETGESGKLEERQLILLTGLSSSAYFLSQNQILHWAALKRARICLQHGHNEIAPYSYVSYAYNVLAAYLNDYQNAYEYGRMAVELSEKYNNLSYKGRTDFLFAIFINHWKKPLAESLPYLRRAIQSCIEGGDLTYAGLAIGSLLSFQINCGRELLKIQQEADNYLSFMRRTNQAQLAGRIRPSVLQPLANLFATTHSFSTFNNEEFDEQQFLKENQTPNFLAHYYGAKFRSLYLFGGYEEILQHFDKLEIVIKSAIEQPIIPETYFYLSLTLTAVLSEMNGKENSVPIFQKVTEEQKKHYHETLEQYQTKMKIWAENGPANYLHKFLLVEAERAKLAGHFKESLDYYQKGIASAKQYNYLNNEALGNELYARFWWENGEEEIAAIYMIRALRLYQHWGATAKVTDLKEKYPQLLTTSSFAINTLSDSASSLDLDTILKASQAISEEIQLETLLQRMMWIIIENAGAQKGVFLLEEQGQWLIKAEGSIENQETIVLSSTPIDAEGAGKVPANLIYYVIRTKEAVVLGNASQEERFMVDPYIHQNQPKSILCEPILHGKKLTGVLYLENNLINGAFTSERLETLRLLSSQAAISIENARLYDNMEELVKERTEALEKTYENIQSDLELAGRFQEAVLPSVQNFDFLKYVVKYYPLSQVSGDVYDIYPNREGAVNIFLGDAMGHGVPAAFMTMMVHIGLDTLRADLPPHKTMSDLNEILASRSGNQFVTGIFVRINDSGELSISNAGHTSLILLPADGSAVVELENPGIPLGMFATPPKSYETISYQLEKGDKFFVYTDGCYEWENEDKEQFEFERFFNFFEENQEADLETILNRLLETLHQFSQGRPCDDDITILGFEYTGADSTH